MWAKLILCAAIVAFSVALGAFAAGKYRARRQFYRQFYTFNERYLTELRFMRRPLGEFFSAYTYEGDFGALVIAAAEHKAWDKKAEYLTQEERAQLADYFHMLGRGDAQSQQACFTAQKGILEEKRTESEREAKTRGELHLKLGLLAGLALVILII